MEIYAFVGASPRDHRGDGGDGGEGCSYPSEPRDSSATRPRRRGDIQAALYLVVGQQHGSGACQRGVCQVAAWGDVNAIRQELRPRASTPDRLRPYCQQQLLAGQPVQRPQPRDQAPRRGDVRERPAAGGGRD